MLKIQNLWRFKIEPLLSSRKSSNSWRWNSSVCTAHHLHYGCVLTAIHGFFQTDPWVRACRQCLQHHYHQHQVEPSLCSCNHRKTYYWWAWAYSTHSHPLHLNKVIWRMGTVGAPPNWSFWRRDDSKCSVIHEFGRAQVCQDIGKQFRFFWQKQYQNQWRHRLHDDCSF